MDSMSDFKSDDDDDDDDLNDSKKFSDNEMKLNPVLKKSKKVETLTNNFFYKKLILLGITRKNVP